MYKIIVVGGGPGGYVAAIRAAQLGAEVTLVEKQSLGGTCLNVGCIPTKALLYTAELYAQAKKSQKFGIMNETSINFKKAQAHKEGIVKQLVGGINGLMKVNRIKIIQGVASFMDSHTLSVNGSALHFDKIILGTGSIPVKPPIPGSDAPQCMDSTGALSLDAIPARMVIIGGGVIGVEMATIYATLGSKVTIVEMMEEILPMMDHELTAMLRKDMVKKGIEIFCGAKVLSVKDCGGFATVQIDNKGQQISTEAEKILVSVGRKSNTEELNLDKIGIQHEGTRIKVNAKQETNMPDIYAIGDCTGGCMLAHVASVQGEIAAENAMGHNKVYNGKTNPSCVYTNPEFAGVGLTEKECISQKIDYILGRFPLSANGKSLIMGESVGMVKILASKKHEEILGVHILGPRATDLIAQGALALHLEATLDEVIETIYAHPTVGETVREASLAVYKRAIHIPNPII